MGKSERTFYLLMNALKVKIPLAGLSKVPGLKAVSRAYLGPDNASITYLPVNEIIEPQPGFTAPDSIVEHFIEASSYRVISYHCMCRKTMGCHDYDPDFACIFLGEDARHIHPSVARPASREEALEHVRRASGQGLITSIGKFRLDAFALGLKGHQRLMSICFCCPCCCLYEIVPHVAPEFQNMVVPLEGIKIEVSEDCDGCGACLDSCLFDQARLVDGRLVPGELCKVCGRCAMTCPEDAVKVTIEDPSYIDECIARLGARVDVT
jgi:ferredoxin